MNELFIKKRSIPAKTRNTDYQYAGTASTGSKNTSAGGAGGVFYFKDLLDVQLTDLSVGEMFYFDGSKIVNTPLFKYDTVNNAWLVTGTILASGDVVSFSDHAGVPSIWASMPIASNTVLGGIKVGANLSIDANGVLSATGGGGGTGFDESADYNPSGAWNYTGSLSINGDPVATWNDVSGSFEPLLGSATSTYYLDGNKQWQILNTSKVAESGALYFTDARARAAALTGFVVGTNTAIISTDSVLSAFQKVQGQLNNKESALTAGTTLQYYRGDKTWQALNSTAVTEGTNLYFTNARAQAAITGGASTIVTSNLTANNVLISNASGKVAISGVSSTELGFLTGVTGNIKTFMDTFNSMFEYVSGTTPYIRAKLNLSGDYDVVAYGNGTFGTIWDSMPTASASVLGGIKVGTGLTITNGILSVNSSIGTGFDQTANYSPSGTWAFSGTVTIGGNAIANQSWVNTNYQLLIPEGTSAQYYRGDKTWQTLNSTAVVEGTNLYFTETRVRASVLAGYVVGANTALAATDSVLGAFQKLQGQVNNREAVLAAGTSTQYYRGDKTWQTLNSTAVTEGTNLYFTETRVRASVLTGYAVGANTVLAATDSILGAFQKLQGQINNRESTIAAGTTSQYYRGDKTWQTLDTSVVTENTNLYFTETRVRASLLTGYAVGANTALLATDSVLSAFQKLQGQVSARQATITGAATTITSSNLTASRALVSDASGKVAVSAITATELGYLSGLSSNIETFMDTFNSMFEYVSGTTPYIRAKLNLSGDYDVVAYGNGTFGTIWDSMPIATASVLGGVKVGTGLTITNGILSVNSSIGTGFDQTANYSPSGTWAFSGAVTIGGAAAATQSWVNTNYQLLISEGTSAQYYRGDKTWQTLNTAAVTESSNLYFTEARVRASLLTGYVVGANTALAATDSVLVAFQKLQGQVNNRQATIATGTTSQYYRGDKTWQTLDTSAVTENTNLYFTDARARSACAASGTVYDSARLGGTLAADYTQRDVGEAISGAWVFNAYQQFKTPTQSAAGTNYVLASFYGYSGAAITGKVQINISATQQSNFLLQHDGDNREAVIGCYSNYGGVYDDLVFKTRDASGYFERMRIASTGEVSVAGLFSSGAFSSTTSGGNYSAIASSGDNQAVLRLVNSTKEYRLIAQPSTAGIANSFYLYDQTAGAARMIINTSGSVNFGGTDLTERLNVGGNIQAYHTTDAYVFAATSTNTVRSELHSTSTYGGLWVKHAGTSIVRLASGGGVSYINNTENFGLGTDTPTHKLHVVASLATNAFLAVNSLSTGYGARIAGGNGTSSHILKLQDYSSTDRVTIWGDGTSLWTAPMTTNLTQGVSTTVLSEAWTYNSSANWGLRLYQVHTGTAIDYQYCTRNNSATDIVSIYVKANGNVGIGGAASATYPLYVDGASYFNGALISAGMITATGSLGLKINGSGTGIANQAYISLYETGGTTRQGYFGFGNSTTSNLYVTNDVTTKYLILTETGQLTYNGSFRTVADDTYIGSEAAQTDVRLGMVKKAGAGAFFATGSASPFSWKVSNTAGIQDVSTNTYTEVMSLSTAGVLVIAGSARASKLSVTGQTGAGNGLSLYASTTDDVYSTVGAYTMPTYGIHFSKTAYFGTHGGVTADYATYFTMSTTAGRGWIFRNIAGNLVSIDNSGNLVASGDVSCASDIRWKTDIKKITDPLTKIQKIAGYTFIKHGNKSGGVIAQEVQQAIPEAIKADSNGYLYVTDSVLTGLTIESVKELIKRDQKKTNIIKNLQKTISAMAKQLADIQSHLKI